jgi:hypothetical protein
MHRNRIPFGIAALACVLPFAARVQADPLPGEVLKFVQMPLNGGVPVPITLPPGAVTGAPAPFPGHDEFSTAYVNPNAPPLTFTGQFMADDFGDKFNAPVVHVQWWGSYLNNSEPASGPVQRFLIAFESNVPAGPASNFSEPGTPLDSQIVTLAPVVTPGMFTEKPIPTAAGNPDGQLFQYNAELALPFNEQAGNIYWLKIVALDANHTASTAPGALQWGWHNRDWGLMNNLANPADFNEAPAGIGPVWHFQDDAVSGNVNIQLPTSGGMPIVLQSGFAPTNYIPGIDIPTNFPTPLSKDLAFALYTVPEPSTILLLGMGAVGLVAVRKRFRRR